MLERTFLIAAALSIMASAQSQPQTGQITPWHVSTTYTFTHDQPGVQTANGANIALVPIGYNAVVEHVSARCAAPPILSILYGEVVPAANPLNPGQSGTAGAPPLEDTAHHPLLFQTTYSGATNVYVASQAMTLRVNARSGDADTADSIRFFGDYLNTGNVSGTITCLFSISGYLQKQ